MERTEHPDYKAFALLMKGTGETIGYTDDGRAIKNRAPAYTLKELREVLKSPFFKKFAALFPKETVQGDTCADTREPSPPARAGGQAQGSRG